MLVTTDPATRAALVEHARLSIKRGSKSFSAASRLFDRTTRERVWLLYAWCRRCDDIADNQEMGGELGDQSDAEERLGRIRTLTARALAGEATPRSMPWAWWRRNAASRRQWRKT